jgi:thiol-disulfide isomerase/thioredoxin
VLLNVWATWCAPCREEIPVLQALHDEHGPRGLVVVGVRVDAPGEAGAIRSFLRETGATYPVWHDSDAVVTTTFLTPASPAPSSSTGAGCCSGSSSAR